MRNPRASQIRHNKHKTTMTSPTSKKYDMEYKLYHLTFTYDDLTTIAGALDFQLNNIDFCGDELEECPVEDFLNKVKNEELEQTGWKPQTRIGECKGCKMICDECENLSIVRDKITKKQYINLKNKWLDDFYSTYPYYNIVKLLIIQIFFYFLLSL